jgi:hypothetical protein
VHLALLSLLAIAGHAVGSGSPRGALLACHRWPCSLTGWLRLSSWGRRDFTLTAFALALP